MGDMPENVLPGLPLSAPGFFRVNDLIIPGSRDNSSTQQLAPVLHQVMALIQQQQHQMFCEDKPQTLTASNHYLYFLDRL